MGKKISLSRVYYPVKVLGPGNRVGIWMNGCPRSCPGCVSPEMQEYDYSKEVSVSDLMNMIKRIQAPIDGFTISGGEPFFRPDALNELVIALATYNDDILLFSGYTLDELKKMQNDSVNSVLNTCSVLVDGPYVENLNDNRGLRGSSNQHCWVFKYSEKYDGIESMNRELQNVVYANNLLTIGIPQRKALL